MPMKKQQSAKAKRPAQVLPFPLGAPPTTSSSRSSMAATAAVLRTAEMVSLLGTATRVASPSLVALDQMTLKVHKDACS